MPITYLFGIFANSINIIVFSQKSMRSQSVNWFFFVLSLSDLTVLIASFFVFSVPVYAEMADNIDMSRASAFLLVWFYPLAQTGLTMSVYLTILVSVHRFLGVCHPFLIRRVSNSSAVKGVIVFAVMFAFLFNTSRWFELQAMPCYSKTHDRMRRMMTMYPRKRRQANSSAINSVILSQPSSATITTTIVSTNHNATTTSTSTTTGHERKENGVTVMLIAITTEFLLFNLLAFANNVLELTGAYGHSQIETLLVEILNKIGIPFRRSRKKPMFVSQPHYETTQLLDSKR
ncbi:hypothetical protein DICVIV_01664 [Dictyocaulus viviparus]|uniref:G-protein coupled receptors family 1 profile domain-containing protein n=1 Tax=Dictyocaulus viviparus TaxID=29172 RepID=A0A0D8Y8A3_DICVI|nr:hypothetical protein DICVIV_01664 [Dictyocaulus viviparus]